MELSPFIQGMIIGLTLAVPIGPISLICIRKAMTGGRLHGILSGFGVATGDSCYVSVAVLGLTAVSGIVFAWQTVFRAISGFVLVIMGIWIFQSALPEPGENEKPGSYSRDYLTLLGIALANPMTILFLLVILPGFGVVIGQMTFLTAFEFVLGFFTGSAAWWVLLCGAAGSVRSRMNMTNLHLINRISGALIALFGLTMLILLIKG